MLPISLRPNGRRAVVIGGGPVAARKAVALNAAGFALLIVAPTAVAQLRALVERHAADLQSREYRRGDADGAALVVTATGDEAIDARVVADARAAGVLVCDAGNPDRGDVVMPCVERVGPITIAVASGTPAFSRKIVGQIAARLKSHYGRAAETLQRMRVAVKAVVPPGQRAAIMDALSALPPAELATMNDDDVARAVEAAISQCVTP